MEKSNEIVLKLLNPDLHHVTFYLIDVRKGWTEMGLRCGNFIGLLKR